jgi:hypothetical protein
MAGGRKGVTVGKQAGYLLHVRGIAAVGVINMRLAGDETDFSTGDNSMHTDTSHGHEPWTQLSMWKFSICTCSARQYRPYRQ